MQIFTGILQARPGKEYEAAALMPQIRDVAQAAHGVETSAWAVIAGSTWGSFALSTRVDGLAQLLEVTAAVGESDDFRALAAQTGEVYAGPAQTSVATVVAATADDVGQPPIASVTRTVAAPGHTKEAVAAAVDILETAASVTGLNGMLLMSDAGKANELSWVFGTESGAQADVANATLAADPAWLDKISAASALFVAGSGERMYIARMP